MKKEQKKDDTFTTSFRISREAWNKIRIRAIEENRKVSDVLIRAFEEYCDRRGAR